MAYSDPGMAAAAMQELNQLEEVILTKVQQRVPARMSEDTYLCKAFRYHDLQGSGWVDFEKFKRTLLPFSPGVGDQDLRAIYGRYAQDGLVCYKQFVADFITGARRSDEAGEEEGPGEFWISAEDTLMRMKSFIYSQGPRGIAALAGMFREADPSNSRAMTIEDFAMALSEIFNEENGCPLQDAQIEQLFDCFRNRYEPNTIAYDDLMDKIKEEPNAERRSAIRGAFRRLDSSSEGLVDIGLMERCYNAHRHPSFSDGSRHAEDIHDEFMDTLKDIVAYRRGQRSYPTNLVAWEEFEDYYKLISGCYESDEAFCGILTKVWDLDKLAGQHKFEARDANARPAAGLPGTKRVGLHHWQDQTLPAAEAAMARRQGQSQIGEVMQRLRALIASKGIRKAVDVVKNFYVVDDDIDDEIDRYEFRRACGESAIMVSEQEEACIFQTCGVGPHKIQVTRFLDLLHGGLSPGRREVIYRAFGSLGGGPESTVNPAVLKANFACENHPQAAKGEVDPGKILAEFLDTFSLLAHVRGGCQNGMVALSDFLDYYTVVSSTIESDDLFELLMNRLWPSQAERDGEQAMPLSARSPRSPKKGGDDSSPMKRDRPPLHDGPSTYYTGPVQAWQEESAAPPVLETHRRYTRYDASAAADASNAPAAPAYSAITKSSIVFDETGSEHLGQMVTQLRDALCRRGLKGWKNLAQRFAQNDNKGNGTVMRLDWERMHRMLGLGLSPEEVDSLFKAFAAGRKDGLMDYRKCLRVAHGPLSEPRRDAVRRLFEELEDTAVGGVLVEDLKASFQPKSVPAVLLGRKDAMAEARDFYECVDYFGAKGGFGEEAFMELFSILSAVHPDDDEFRLMTTAAFGLQSAGANRRGGC